MPPTNTHAPEGVSKTLSPSSHIASLLDDLRQLFRHATQHSFCPVAAAAYAAHQQPIPPTQRLPPQRFQMGPHLAHTPRSSNLCSCVTKANTNYTHTPPPLTQPPHRDRRRRHQSNPTQINDLRKEMQNLDDAAKMALMRDTMMSRYKRSKTLELENNVRRLFEDQYKRLSTTGAVVPAPSSPIPTTIQPQHHQHDHDHHHGPDTMLGCRHYARRCKLKAKCCGLFVTCRFCHDEAMSEDHEMDRFATDTILCMICMKEQHVKPNCAECGVEFAHYFCKECRFYENTPGKKVYHCHRCRICRLGEGLEIDNFHCDNCDACVSLPTRPNHRCTSKALHANCPVCRGYLFTSTEPVVFMRCGHGMHTKCFDDYTVGSYQCPLCLRSLTDMKQYYEQIDEVVRSEPMPEEYDNKRSDIFCSDCETKSTVKYHFMYHKCADCNGYNTTILRVFDVDDDKDAFEEQSEQVRTTGDLNADPARVEHEHPPASGDLRVAERPATPLFYSSDRASSFSSIYVESGDELPATDDGQFTQAPIESTV